MSLLSFAVMNQTFSIHRFSPNEPVPPSVYASSVFWIGKTDDELSIVCDSSIDLQARECESDWSCLKVLGPIDFSVTGLIAGISGVLASAGIGVFVISTFDTDYILVKEKNLTSATRALKGSGYEVGGAI